LRFIEVDTESVVGETLEDFGHLLPVCVLVVIVGDYPTVVEVCYDPGHIREEVVHDVLEPMWHIGCAHD
jgi:hypothetical protein